MVDREKLDAARERDSDLLRRVQFDGLAHECLEGSGVYLLALTEVDRSSNPPLEARVEQLGRIVSPSWDQTGMFHFHSSTTRGSACLMSARTRASVAPRQSLNSAILASIF
jgi:hypothetical protein